MLSQDNINKLSMTGIYRCDPVESWLPSYLRDNPYHCHNWTFKVGQSRKDPNIYYMVDTYWNTGDSFRVELEDENFDKFEFLFDLTEVHKVSKEDFYDYDKEDWYHVALDSGGYQYSKYYFVKDGARKNKEIQLFRLQEKLKSAEWEVEHIKRMIEIARNES